MEVREFLRSFAEAALAELPALERFTVDGARLGFELAEGSIELEVRRPDPHPAWCALSHLAVNVRCEPAPPPPDLHRTLRALRALLRRADPGPLAFTAPLARPTALRRRTISPALARELDRAAYLACRIFDAEPRILPRVTRHDGRTPSTWRAMVLEEFYPYMGALGVPLDDDDIERGWAESARLVAEGRGPEGLDVYLHIPFCTVQCRFCYCAVSTDVSVASFERYVEHLCRELTRFGALVGHLPVRTVFVGGGTPALLPPRLLERLFTTLHGALATTPETQITVESNPDSLTRERLETLVATGRMNRLTIGIQSIDPEAQRRADRFNDPARIRRLATLARQLGVRHLNVDVIAGLDGQSIEAFQRDVEFALSLEPDSFHVSPFRPVREDRFEADPEQVERRRAMVAWATEALARRGLEHRKNLPASRHPDAVNEQIFRFHELGASLLGLGASAYSHSFGGHAYEHPFALRSSLTSIGRGRRAPYRGLPLEGMEEAHRFLVHAFFQLGFPLERFRARFGIEPWDAAPGAWERFEDLDLVTVEDGAVRFAIRSHAELAILRVLLFGPLVRARAEALFGADYDPAVDHRARVDAICSQLL